MSDHASHKEISPTSSGSCTRVPAHAGIGRLLGGIKLGVNGGIRAYQERRDPDLQSGGGARRGRGAIERRGAQRQGRAGGEARRKSSSWRELPGEKGRLR